ncbi:MAG: alpha-L-fucosidase [Verrucomicrobiia bacterium]
MKIFKAGLVFTFSFLLQAVGNAQQTSAVVFAISPGPFKPTMESLTNYNFPEWFRNAKFGIWAHWGPQAVPMEGDWYARNMYIQGNRQYEHHLTNYGHPSVHGYKDIIPLWKAEKWEPDKLMALYKKAGARYFVSMGVHHDNFDLWNSTYHKWNAVNMGPKRDVVGEWQKAAKKYGLKFGVSEHLGASFTWFQPSHGSDKTGPKAGVPYDGANSNYWDLYHPPADPDDKGWYSKSPEWQKEWSTRIKDLVDKYKPDLLYTDGAVPFNNEVGLSLIAHLYNSDYQRNKGKNQVVYTCKQSSGGRWVEDLERGVMGKINPYPWQTDTSIGDWYYNKNWKFRPVEWTIHMLIDIVSKNGNLLLNVVQRPDGSIDPEVEQMLNQMAKWIAINGEAIYDTRPWQIYGEGKTRARGGSFREDYKYTASDIRFTTKGNTLYAFAMGLPENGEIVIRSLAKTDDPQQNKISKINLLGYSGKIKFTQTSTGLVIRLPEKSPCDYAIAFKISGKNLKPVSFEVPPPTVEVDRNGNYTLSADDAQLRGSQIKVEDHGGQPNIGFWDRADEWAEWKVNFKQPGEFNVVVATATIHSGATLAIECQNQKLLVNIPSTGDWAKFQNVSAGKIQISQPGEYIIKAVPPDRNGWKAINVRRIRLEKVRN